jgi:hypothetical protein
MDELLLVYLKQYFKIFLAWNDSVKQLAFNVLLCSLNVQRTLFAVELFEEFWGLASNFI